MSTESKPERQPIQTWGEFNKIQDGHEKDMWGQGWFEAGYVGDIALDQEMGRQALHLHLDSFSKALFETDDRPFQFVVSPAVPKRTAKNPDVNVLNVLIKPCSDGVTVDQLREFTDKVKGQ